MGHADVVQCLLTTDDVDVDARDALGATPLWAAARNGRVRVTQLLLQHRAEKDAGRFYGGFMEVLWRGFGSSFYSAIIKSYGFWE